MKRKRWAVTVFLMIFLFLLLAYKVCSVATAMEKAYESDPVNNEGFYEDEVRNVANEAVVERNSWSHKGPTIPGNCFG